MQQQKLPATTTAHGRVQQQQQQHAQMVQRKKARGPLAKTTERGLAVTQLLRYCCHACATKKGRAQQQ